MWSRTSVTQRTTHGHVYRATSAGGARLKKQTQERTGPGRDQGTEDETRLDGVLWDRKRTPCHENRTEEK